LISLSEAEGYLSLGKTKLSQGKKAYKALDVRDIKRVSPLEKVAQIANLATSLKVLGWRDTRGLHPALFVELHAVPAEGSAVSLPSDLAGVSVRGRLISDDDNINVNWESPLEGSSIEGKFSELTARAKSGLVEKYTGLSAMAGRTLTNKIETIQIMKGIENQELSLMLEFVAYRDASLEVEAPRNALKKMASPQLTDGVIDSLIQQGTSFVDEIKNGSKEKDVKYFGETAFDIILTIGGRRLKRRYVISSISSDRDTIRVDRNGNDVYRQVNLTLKSKQAIMRDEISLKKG